MDEKEQAIAAIRRKLVGNKLTYKEIYSIMDQISQNRLGDVLTTYFAASGFSKGFSDEEIFFLTKAMVETGQKLKFKGIVADKHSIGGIPGTRTTLVVVPIIAAAGFQIPKSSSRAITTPSGTADDMEILAPVDLSRQKIYSVVKKTNGCIVWGGSFNIAPADDVIIKVEEVLLFESYDKILISIMAKKVAFGSNHVVIDIPYGKSVKVHNLNDAKLLKSKFEKLAARFEIKIEVLIHKTEEPAGRGIGPILEVKESLMVLEQDPNRSLDLEARSINLAGSLLELCLADSPATLQNSIRKKYKNGFNWAQDLLESGLALSKMKQIIKAQGGNPKIGSGDLKPGEFSFTFLAPKKCVIESFNVKNLTLITRVLGAPDMKGAGIFLNKKIGEKIDRGEPICTFYSDSMYNLKEGKDSLKNFPLIEFK
ncbi:MAG: thymidine phosphorylase [Candidatus Levybacteria bacterium]|nr:thymidine phosphorylase [Candidatus Levybacteria bacterium]